MIYFLVFLWALLFCCSIYFLAAAVVDSLLICQDADSINPWSNAHYNNSIQPHPLWIFSSPQTQREGSWCILHCACAIHLPNSQFGGPLAPLTPYKRVGVLSSGEQGKLKIGRLFPSLVVSNCPMPISSSVLKLLFKFFQNLNVFIYKSQG